MIARIDALVPGPVRQVCRRLGERGHEAYAVGGAVRDALLGREPGDWDVATSATPEQVIALFERTFPTGLQHGTVTVLVREQHGRAGGGGRPPGRMAIEVTTFRGEGAYTDGRHPDSVTFGVPLREDLARRDFSVNAIAYDPVARRLADPFGGVQDLAARRLRAVGDPAARFGEDGLRVMRAVRLAAALGFDLDPATEGAIPGALPVLARVSAERVRDELQKTLRAPVPSRGLEIARRTGILGQVLPGLGFGPHGRGGAGDAGADEDPRWRRAMARVDAAAAPVAGEASGETPDAIPDEAPGKTSGDDRARIRLAALLLELRVEPAPGAGAAGPGDAALADAADAVCLGLKLSGADRERVVSAVRFGRAWAGPPRPDRDLRALLGDIGRVRVPDSIAVWEAERAAAGAVGAVDDARAAAELARRAGDIWRRGDPLAVGELAIAGGDVLRILQVPPGPVVGVVLRALLSRVLADPDLNTPDGLAALVPAVHAEVAGA